MRKSRTAPLPTVFGVCKLITRPHPNVSIFSKQILTEG